jgi:uncharacterized membrane-anchored protein
LLFAETIRFYKYSGANSFLDLYIKKALWYSIFFVIGTIPHSRNNSLDCFLKSCSSRIILAFFFFYFSILSSKYLLQIEQQ